MSYSEEEHSKSEHSAKTMSNSGSESALSGSGSSPSERASNSEPSVFEDKKPQAVHFALQQKINNEDSLKEYVKKSCNYLLGIDQSSDFAKECNKIGVKKAPADGQLCYKSLIDILLANFDESKYGYFDFDKNKRDNIIIEGIKKSELEPETKRIMIANLESNIRNRKGEKDKKKSAPKPK